jgi:hypothetical protein
VKHYLIQYKFWRKHFGGTYYLLHPIQLFMAPFWSDVPATSQQTKTIGIETYPIKK